MGSLSLVADGMCGWRLVIDLEAIVVSWEFFSEKLVEMIIAKILKDFRALRKKIAKDKKE